MNRPVWALLAVLLAAGCAPATGPLGPAPTGPPVTGGGTPSEPAATRTATAPSTAPAPRTGPAAGGTPGAGPSSTSASTPAGALALQLWFVRAGRLVPTRHSTEKSLGTSRLAIAELVAGPSPAEADAGLTTLVPGAGVEVAGIAEGVETVTIAAGFDAGTAAAVRLRQAQVVYSLTQFPTVDRVVFRATGRPDPRPVGRGDFADLLPPIVVTAPAIGDRLSSPVTVVGTADVFEATVTIRILDAAGRPIATAFTVASCGSGCRGDYRLAVGYRLPATQRGRIEVYQVSPRDGSPVDTVSLPVTLSAGG